MEIRDIFFEDVEDDYILGYLYITTPRVEIYRGLVVKSFENDKIISNIFSEKKMKDRSMFIKVKNIPCNVKSIRKLENAKLVKELFII